VKANVVVIVWSNANDVSIFALEGGASEDDALVTGGESTNGFLTEEGEPVPAVGVGEGDAFGHLFDVGGGMELERVRKV